MAWRRSGWRWPHRRHMKPLRSGCIMWPGLVGMDGYGKRQFQGKTWRAHRFAWFLERGEIPEGMQVLHHCDVPLCVNVEHLFLGTNMDNVLDAMSKKRHCHGSRNGRAKLTYELVDIIRQEYIPFKNSTIKLAAKYQVSPSTIQWIIDGERWKDTNREAS